MRPFLSSRPGYRHEMNCLVGALTALLNATLWTAPVVANDIEQRGVHLGASSPGSLPSHGVPGLELGAVWDRAWFSAAIFWDDSANAKLEGHRLAVDVTLVQARWGTLFDRSLRTFDLLLDAEMVRDSVPCVLVSGYGGRCTTRRWGMGLGGHLQFGGIRTPIGVYVRPLITVGALAARNPTLDEGLSVEARVFVGLTFRSRRDDLIRRRIPPPRDNETE